MAKPRTTRSRTPGPTARVARAPRRPELPARATVLARLRATAPRRREPALLGAPLTSAKLAVIERRLGAPLPEPLRGFVLAVGNGGLGPHGRLFSIDEGIAELDAPADAAARPPFSSTALARAIAEKRLDRSHVLYDPDGEQPPLRGVLPVADAGDGLLYAVVMQGKHAGQVWLVGEAWSPELGADDGPADFVAWYLAWLDDAAPVIAAKPRPVRATVPRALDPSWPKALRAALEAPAKARKLGLGDFFAPAIPDVFDRLPGLEELSISHSTASALPGSMRSLVKLRKLWLTSMDQLADLEAITALPRLQFLNLARSSEVRITESIAGLVSLEVLILSFTNVQALPAALAKLPRLHRLDLDLCFDLDLRQAWPVIARLPALRTLTLAGSRLLRWPTALERPPSLAQLDLSGAEMPEGQLERVRAALPGVTLVA